MSILREIIERKKERLSSLKRQEPLISMRKRAEEAERERDFAAAVRRGDGDSIRLIAEVKKASPSKGLIRKTFNLKEIAEAYRKKGVNAISVLTEEDYFSGSPDYIGGVKKIASCPVLRKDFIFDEYQVYEAKVIHADALLLIAAALSRSQAEELLSISRETGLDVLFEVHNLKELDTAMYLDCNIIGINNRNLKSLEVNISTTLDMIKDIPPGKIVVSESGMNSCDDVGLVEKAGAHAVLIGTSIMKSDNMEEKIDLLMKKGR